MMLVDSASFVMSGFLLTYAGWQGVVPLCQVVWHALAAYGGGAVQHVARVTLELHQGADGKVVAQTLPETRLRDRAALGGAGPRHGCKKEIMTG